MKEKIRLALVAKYKSQGFSSEAIDAMLAYLEKRVTAEDQIDAAVDEVGGIFTGFQKEVDRRANQFKSDAEKWQESQKGKGGDPNKGGDPAKPANEPTPPADVPEWMKPFMTTVTNLVNEVSSLKAGKVGETRKSQVEKALENVSETYRKGKLGDFDRMNFKDDDDFNSYLEGVKTDSAEFVQTETNAGLSKAGKPIMATGGVQQKQATDAELDSAMSNFSI